MTEDEYNLIKLIENKTHDVMDKMSMIEEINDPKELSQLHSEIEKILEKLVITLKNGSIKSTDAVMLLEKMKMGFIETLVYIDQSFS